MNGSSRKGDQTQPLPDSSSPFSGFKMEPPELDSCGQKARNDWGSRGSQVHGGEDPRVYLRPGF